MSYKKSALIVLILLIVVGLLLGYYDCKSVSEGVALCTGVGVIGLLTGTLMHQSMKRIVDMKTWFRYLSAALSLFACAFLLYYLVWSVVPLCYKGYFEQRSGHDLALLGMYLTLCTIACPVAVIFGYGVGQSK